DCVGDLHHARSLRDPQPRRLCRGPVVRAGADAIVARHLVHRGCTGAAQSRDANAWADAADADAGRYPRRTPAARPEPAVDLAADYRSDCRHDRRVRCRLRRLPARGSARLKDWTITAALNNARWCNAVCFAHGTVGRFLVHTWVNAEPVPRFYPN